MTKQSLGAALAALRPRRNYTCIVCGAEFEAQMYKTKLPKFCSNKCRQKAKYQRSKENQHEKS